MAQQLNLRLLRHAFEGRDLLFDALERPHRLARIAGTREQRLVHADAAGAGGLGDHQQGRPRLHPWTGTEADTGLREQRLHPREVLGPEQVRQPRLAHHHRATETIGRDLVADQFGRDLLGIRHRLQHRARQLRKTRIRRMQGSEKVTSGTVRRLHPPEHPMCVRLGAEPAGHDQRSHQAEDRYQANAAHESIEHGRRKSVPAGCDDASRVGRHRAQGTSPPRLIGAGW